MIRAILPVALALVSLLYTAPASSADDSWAPKCTEEGGAVKDFAQIHLTHPQATELAILRSWLDLMTNGDSGRSDGISLSFQMVTIEMIDFAVTFAEHHPGSTPQDTAAAYVGQCMVVGPLSAKTNQ
jgi:hypothetical protein